MLPLPVPVKRALAQLVRLWHTHPVLVVPLVALLAYLFLITPLAWSLVLCAAYFLWLSTTSSSSLAVLNRYMYSGLLVAFLARATGMDPTYRDRRHFTHHDWIRQEQANLRRFFLLAARGAVVSWLVLLCVNVGAIWFVAGQRARAKGLMWMKSRSVSAVPGDFVSLARLSIAYEAALSSLGTFSRQQNPNRPALLPSATLEDIEAWQSARARMLDLYVSLVHSSDEAVFHSWRALSSIHWDALKAGTRSSQPVGALLDALRTELYSRPATSAMVSYLGWVEQLVSALSLSFLSSSATAQWPTLYPPFVRTSRPAMLDNKVSLLLPLVVPYPFLRLDFQLFLHVVFPASQLSFLPPLDAAAHNSHIALVLDAVNAFAEEEVKLYGGGRDSVLQAVGFELSGARLEDAAVRAEARTFEAVVDEVVRAVADKKALSERR
ncbi:hypothetical protein JCM8097_007641 [Rhodosporidiobolus ruineniae]